MPTFPLPLLLVSGRSCRCTACVCVWALGSCLACGQACRDLCGSQSPFLWSVSPACSLCAPGPAPPLPCRRWAPPWLVPVACEGRLTPVPSHTWQSCSLEPQGGPSLLCPCRRPAAAQAGGHPATPPQGQQHPGPHRAGLACVPPALSVPPSDCAVSAPLCPPAHPRAPAVAPPSLRGSLPECRAPRPCILSSPPGGRQTLLAPGRALVAPASGPPGPSWLVLWALVHSKSDSRSDSVLCPLRTWCCQVTHRYLSPPGTLWGLW